MGYDYDTYDLADRNVPPSVLVILCFSIDIAGWSPTECQDIAVVTPIRATKGILAWKPTRMEAKTDEIR